jgi:hypothetical protein
VNVNQGSIPAECNGDFFHYITPPKTIYEENVLNFQNNGITVAGTKLCVSPTSLSLRVEGKPKTLDIGTETASYKVLLLGNNVYSLDSIYFICYPSHPSDPLACYF